MHQLKVASHKATLRAHKPYRICIAVSPDVSEKAEQKAVRLGQTVSQYGSSLFESNIGIQEQLPILPERTLAHELARHADMALADGHLNSVERHDLTDMAIEFFAQDKDGLTSLPWQRGRTRKNAMFPTWS